MLNQNLKEFIQSLNDNHVRYLVIGVYAVALHGYPRYTKDIDVWIETSSENAVNFESCYASRVEVVVDEVTVNFIDLDNLKKSKKAAGRLQDLADLENLE